MKYDINSTRVFLSSCGWKNLIEVFLYESFHLPEKSLHQRMFETERKVTFFHNNAFEVMHGCLRMSFSTHPPTLKTPVRH